MSSENNVKSKDLHLINDLNAALQKEKHSGQFWVIILFSFFSRVRDLGVQQSDRRSNTWSGGTLFQAVGNRSCRALIRALSLRYWSKKAILSKKVKCC